MIQVLKIVFYLGPLLFGFGFVAPLTAQTFVALSIEPPFGLSPLVAGLIVGGTLGLIAQIRGRWI